MKISDNAKRVFARFVIFGFLGMLFEVVLGGFWRLFADGEPLLRGFSSMWMIPDYGMLGILTMPLARPMLRRKFPLVLRAFVYMICIYIIEFISGWIFDQFGLKVWSNLGLKYQLCGYVALRYAPCWYFIGLVAEYTYRKVDAVAVLFTRGLTAEDLLKQTSI